MEDNKDEKTVDEKEKTGEVGTQTTDKDEGKAYKTFKTEDEYNNAVKSILKQKLPPKEEMKAFKEWQESQKTEEQKQAEKEKENAQKEKELSDIKKELAVYKAGVKNDDDVEFVTFKVSKLEGDFSENLAKFLKDNPKYLGTEETKIVKKVGSSLNLGGKQNLGQNETNQTMNNLIRSVRD